MYATVIGYSVHSNCCYLQTPALLPANSFMGLQTLAKHSRKLPSCIFVPYFRPLPPKEGLAASVHTDTHEWVIGIIKPII